MSDRRIPRQQNVETPQKEMIQNHMPKIQKRGHRHNPSALTIGNKVNVNVANRSSYPMQGSSFNPFSEYQKKLESNKTRSEVGGIKNSNKKNVTLPYPSKNAEKP